MKNKILKSSLYIIVSILVGVTAVYAVDKLTAPSAPTKTMHSLSDIYNLIDPQEGYVATSTYQAPEGTPTPTPMPTLEKIYTDLSTEVGKLSSSVIASGTTAFGIVGEYEGTPGTNYGIPKTGQTSSQCWDETGTLITCTGTGQDGDLKKGIALSYTDNGNGTVTDNATGLIWQKQDDGVGKTWTNALAYCNNANTAGLPGTGWRLPNIKELQSIVDFSTVSPAINSTFFPSTQSNSYWSSSTYVGDQASAWGVYFYDGYPTYNGKTYPGGLARCVR